MVQGGDLTRMSIVSVFCFTSPVQGILLLLIADIPSCEGQVLHPLTGDNA